MVTRNKWIAIFEAYEVKLQSTIPSRIAKGQKLAFVLKSDRSKSRVLRFFLRNNYWPTPHGNKKNEATLASRFNSIIHKTSTSYDPVFAALVTKTGRITRYRSKNNPAKFKKEILKFIDKNGYVPRGTKSLKKECNMRSKLSYYTRQGGDMTFLGQVYDLDKLHKSGIPVKYRKLLNEKLNLDKPLIQLVK